MGLFNPYNNFADIYTHNFLSIKSISGTAAIVDASQTETTPWTILTITALQEPLNDVEVWLDLALATTGFAAVESTATIQFAVARAVDGTNFRREAYQEAALSGTNAALRMARLMVGRVPVAGVARVMAVMSADATADFNLPYQVIYRGLQAPTVA